MVYARPIGLATHVFGGSVAPLAGSRGVFLDQTCGFGPGRSSLGGFELFFLRLDFLGIDFGANLLRKFFAMAR